MDGYKIYWATAYDFGPTGGPVFLHIPRQAGDGWEHESALLTERPESALMLAMEAHNEAVRAAKNAAASDTLGGTEPQSGGVHKNPTPKEPDQ